MESIFIYSKYIQNNDRYLDNNYILECKEPEVNSSITYAFSLHYNLFCTVTRERFSMYIHLPLFFAFPAIVLQYLQRQLTICLSAAWHALIELCDWSWKKTRPRQQLWVIPGRTAGRRRKVAAFIAVAGRRQREPGGWVVTGFKVGIP